MKQSIGQRITISKKESETIIRINGTVEGWMNHALLGWVFLWSMTGLYVIYFLFSGKAQDDQYFFFITYLTFWSFFEYKAVYSWLFRVKGYELIKVLPDAVYIKRGVFSFGKMKRYVRENIKDLKKVSQENNSLSSVYNKSFWVMGNEQIMFNYIGENVGFGMHLTQKDTSALLLLVRKMLKKK
ncbi:MAG: hypothetical protein ACI85Q_002874 [Salibacteraceae bacterium]|jgi:hypothetical protein